MGQDETPPYPEGERPRPAVKAARAIALAADQTGNEAPAGNLPAAHEEKTLLAKRSTSGRLPVDTLRPQES